MKNLGKILALTTLLTLSTSCRNYPIPETPPIQYEQKENLENPEDEWPRQIDEDTFQYSPKHQEIIIACLEKVV